MAHIICPSCGERVKGTKDQYICHNPNCSAKKPKEELRKGWQCPRCCNIISPYNIYCPTCAPRTGYETC
jgi:hypothetical protein